MSLSDWDVLAWDQDGKPCDGWVGGFVAGTRCGAVKNCISVMDDRPIQQGSECCTSTVVARIEYGLATVANFNVLASATAPQDGVFFAITTAEPGGEHSKFRRAVGVSCVGWKYADDVVLREEGLDPAEWEFECMGSVSEPRSVADLQKAKVWSARRPPPPSRWTLKFSFCRSGDSSETVTFSRPDDERYAVRWVGVEQSTVESLVQWLRRSASLYPPSFALMAERIAGSMAAPMPPDKSDVPDREGGADGG